MLDGLGFCQKEQKFTGVLTTLPTLLNVSIAASSSTAGRWEDNDDAMRERFAHTNYSDRATVVSVHREDDDQMEPEMRVSRTNQMGSARSTTFARADGWSQKQ